jgi:N utilization substance protein A
MLDIKALSRAIEQLANEKDIDPSQVLEAVEAALASAYKKEYDKKGEVIRCVLDTKTGDIKFFQVKTVVDNNSVRFQEDNETSSKQKEKDENLLPLYNPERHILLKEAKEIKPDAVVGDELYFDLPSYSTDFGRIAAQTAKQVILQKLREIEKASVKLEFENKVGQLVSGVVQRIERGNVFVDLGKASGIMFFSESIPGEHYRIGERLRFYLLSVQESGRGPQLILSRSHPKFIAKLFELEVPEIAEGIVVIKGIVREPGSRTKIAVASNVEGVDPVGACVGQRGARVMAVNNEIGNEKIDIIEWSQDPVEYVANSLSPAIVASVEIRNKNEALVLVPEDQLSLAIGKGGQNVRLAAKLTGYKIDVRSQSNPDVEQEGGIAEAEKEDEKDTSLK